MAAILHGHTQKSTELLPCPSLKRGDHFFEGGGEEIAHQFFEHRGAEGELDDEVELVSGLSIAEICAQHGEATFRDFEERALSEALNRGPSIVSCGGGVVLRASNRELLSRMSLPIWLCASTEEILSRIEDFSTRPLINSKAPAQSFNDLFLERKLHYAEVAQLVIDTEGESPQKIAQRIADEISATWPN